jgi:rubrerythrin
MTTLTPTKEKGATAKPVPGLYVDPQCVATDEQLAEPFEGNVNGPFVMDLLSAMLAHERCGRHLYRSVEGRTNNPVLKAKYKEFGEQTEEHVVILEELVTRMGGNPNYVSPSARAVQGMDTKLIESTFALGGSIDMMTAEMAMLDAVMLAEKADHANWETFAALTRAMPEGATRDAFRAAVDHVEPQEDEHERWPTETKQKMVLLQAQGSMMAKVGEKAEEMLARVKGMLGS